MSLFRHIPNFLTLLNLCLGVIGASEAALGRLHNAWYLMLLCGILDLADGFVARWLNVITPIGKELDSLADLVSFGVTPALALMSTMRELGSLSSNSLNNQIVHLIPFISVILPASTALRLARFNHDPNQSKWFRGLPSPASGLFAISFTIWVVDLNTSASVKVLVCVAMILILSAFMLSPIRLASLKIKSNSRIKAIIILALSLISGILIYILNFGAALPILLMYFIVSIFVHQLMNTTK